MVSISHEKPHEIESRLRHIIREAKLAVFDNPFAFEEFSLDAFREHANMDALAFVRDDQVWSQLVKSPPDSPEPFVIWRFHFPPGADNSGFVGWLATHLKTCFGTGVFVLCGQNSNAGGIFDYWGCPWELRESVLSEVRALVAGNT
jgi:hypothetical protein